MKIKPGITLVFLLIFSLLVPVGLLPVPVQALDSSVVHRDVPFVPTPEEVVAEMLRLANVNDRDLVYDLGCGDGRIVITAARDMGARGIGIDIDPNRIQESRENAREAGVEDQVSFRQEDLFKINFRDASVLTLYLLPDVNLRLRPKILAELRPGTRVVSHDFDMEDWAADQVSRLGRHTVFFWVIPANASGTWEWQGAGGEPYRLALEQHFQKISGIVKTGDKQMSVVKPRLEGDRLHFEIDDGPQGRVVFEGIVRGNAIKGKLRATGKEASEWKAARDPATMTAAW
jgi:SAM-dependent methyltransferase